MAYTPEQIKQFITDKGIANDPYAMYNYAKQYGVSAGEVDNALGAQSGQSASWISKQGLPQIGQQGGAQAGAGYSDAQVKDMMGRLGGSPQSMYTMAQQTGISSDQVDRAMGYDKGTSQNWIQQQGLGQLGAPQQPPPPGGGGTPPSMPPPNPYMPNPTANPNQPMAGGQGGQGGPGQQNPYMQQIGQDITRQVTNNLQRNILPGIGRGAVAAGGYGGSRQGIAEGLAIGETNANLSGQLANLYGNQFNTDRNYGLQSDALDLNVYNANQNWMNQGQQNQIGLIDRMLGWNQQGLNTATQAQNTPLNYWQQFTNGATQIGGMGGTNSQQLQGNPYLGAIGGAMTGYNLYNQFNK